VAVINMTKKRSGRSIQSQAIIKRRNFYHITSYVMSSTWSKLKPSLIERRQLM